MSHLIDTCIQPTRRNGFTRIELLAATGSAVVLCAVGSTVLARNGGANDSHYKLMALGQAHDCYANDFNGRQWGVIPPNAGAYGDNCSTYISSNGCPDVLLGRDASNALWGFWLGCNNTPGSCSNWKFYRPMNFATADMEIGSFRLANIWGFREYVSRNFYSPDWFAEDDPAYLGASTQFDSTGDFTYPVSALPEGIAYSSYAMSPAAMLHPDVLRARAEGGFQAPSSFADSYRAPAVAQCTYPSLKTRMIEYGWFRGAPSAGLAFSSGRESAPVTLFFDGSVASITMARAEADDAILRATNKSGDGLWSDDTPLGANGWQPDGSVDGLRTGFHMLTTGGLLGRDLLSND
jgi:hypothetical protein